MAETPEEQPRAEEAEPRREYRGTGIYVAAILGFLLVVALIIFIIQNTEGVELEWTVWEADVSLAAVVIAALAAGAALAELVGFWWRHQRRKSLQEREELRRLRSKQHG